MYSIDCDGKYSSNDVLDQFFGPVVSFIKCIIQP
uniref:Uncharacterized protein n=1 Tax=Schistosoma curassoni TaxID=6186 RepID=A0A183JTW4_9TREM